MVVRRQLRGPVKKDMLGVLDLGNGSFPRVVRKYRHLGALV